MERMDSPSIKGEIREKTTFCEDCDRYFSSKFSLKRHRRVVHGSLGAPYHVSQLGGGIKPPDSGSSDDESSNQHGGGTADHNGSESESGSESSETSGSDTEDSENEPDGPKFNKYDVLVANYLIHLMDISDAADDEELTFAREFYNIHSHFRKSNMYKVIKNAVNHFSDQLELMSKTEAIKAGVGLRSPFILALFKHCNKKCNTSDMDE